MEKIKNKGSVYIAVILAVAALTGFIIQSKMAWHPIVLFLVCLFVLFPYRKESRLAGRVFVLTILLFIGWLIFYLGSALIPFAVSFLLAYLLDPFVSRLARNKIPRWLATLVIILILLGIVALIAIYVFPALYKQLDSAIAEISNIVASVSSFINSKEFYNLLSDIGISQETAKNTVETQIMPNLEKILSGILSNMSTLFESVAGIAGQLLNAILIPVLAFYFLKDFSVIKEYIKSLLRTNNPKALYHLRRVNRIFRIYISWQVTAAIIVGTVCSTFFSIFDIPYAIVLGIICGVLNPIPYLGVALSFFVCIITFLLVSPDSFLRNVIVASAVISGMHFTNAYFLEPNIAGKQVGLHPLVIIASLYVFGGMFGFFGMLFAVPCTASLVMFFNDWRETSQGAQIDFEEE